MHLKLISTGAISVGFFLINQILRFASNIVLAKMLTPSSFGLMAVVNMIMLGLSLLSDLGLRLVVIQHKSTPTPLFLNTVWVLQILRGGSIWLIATLMGLGLWVLQFTSIVSDNAYADPLLPYMVIVGALGVLLAGVESTNTTMAMRSLAVVRMAVIGLIVQVLTLTAILCFAFFTRSPWALVWGGLAGNLVQCLASYFCFGRFTNSWQFDKQIAIDILNKARWLLLSSPLTFLEMNGAVLLLGAMINPTELGQFMIAFSIVGVLRLVSQQLTSSIMFPAFSACFRDSPDQIFRLVSRFQVAVDGVLVLTAGGFFIAGPAIIGLLFDHRYAAAGHLVSILGIGLIGSRQCVAEQLFTAKGWFKATPFVILSRLIILLLGCVGGYYFAGINGAAWGITLSWFAAWPFIYWKRMQIVMFSLKSEFIGSLMFLTGCWLGYIFTYVTRIIDK